MSWSRKRIAAAVAATLIIVLVVALVIVVPWPKTPAEWVTGKAPVEVMALILGTLGALGAFAGVLVNIYFANRTLRFAQKADGISRFQRAAELISSDKDASVAAGLAMLRAVVAESDRDIPAAGELLVSFINQRSAEAVRMMQKGEQQLLEASRMTANALKLIGPLTIRQNQVLAGKNSVAITDIDLLVLDNRIFLSNTFANILVHRALFTKVSFFNCTFRKAQIQVIRGTEILFQDCKLWEVQLIVINPDGKPAEPTDTATLRFTGLNEVSDNSSINDISIANWLGSDGKTQVHKAPDVRTDQTPVN